MKWFVTFVDDCTRMTWVYQLKHKSDVCTVFRMFHHMVATQFGIQMKVLRSDNRGECFKKELTDFMRSVGVIHQTTCPYSHQQNGFTKRKNQQLLEVTRSLLIGGHVPSHLWGESLSLAVCLIIRTPSSVLNFRRPLDALSDHCTIPLVILLAP